MINISEVQVSSFGLSMSARWKKKGREYENCVAKITSARKNNAKFMAKHSSSVSLISWLRPLVGILISAFLDGTQSAHEASASRVYSKLIDS